MVIGNSRYKTYLVRRLADGNCWMVQNLDLNLKNFTSDKTARLTSENTDVATTWIPDASINSREWSFGNTTITGGYNNIFGLSGVLEPGPDVATAEVAATRTTANYQFQDRPYFGRNLPWASRYLAGTTTAVQSTDTYAIQIRSTGVYVQVNSNSAYPRSYNNDFGYISGTLSVQDQAACIANATAQVKDHNKCSMNGAASDAGGNNTAFPQTDDGLTQDTTWQPELVTYSSQTQIGADTETGNPIYGADDQYTTRGSMYIGDYYNWYAATAETGKWNMGGSTAEASGSICPAGWKLPSNTKSASVGGSWSYLLGNDVYAYSNASGGSQHSAIIKMMQLPLSIPYSGRYFWSTGTLSARGYYASFWTSTSHGATVDSNAHYLYFGYDGNINSQNSSEKPFGFTVRCVARGTENQVTPPEDVVQSTCSSNSICYDANGGTGNTMANTGSATFGSSKVLSAPTYTRTGYAFVGWSESKDAVQSGAYIYGPNETITVPNLSSEGMTLYAQWLAPENSSYTMQAFGRNETVKTCSNMTDGNNGTTEERIALRDERDDNVYIVTKLKDGNCWMTSNLALNLADFAGKTTGTLLTPENTDLTASREDLSTLTIEGVGG
ncbi:InlB B-repeat-containing protein, partial [Candidatus Saccharibacteria bacterium]|nr:InlB B-repeat-containing protein [Candidatus Saccharibacteria bacterium]